MMDCAVQGYTRTGYPTTLVPADYHGGAAVIVRLCELHAQLIEDEVPPCGACRDRMYGEVEE